MNDPRIKTKLSDLIVNQRKILCMLASLQQDIRELRRRMGLDAEAHKDDGEN